VKACISEHHERYDGKGYPSGIKKDELTLEGRILAVADAFDSMISDRPYRMAMTDQEAIEELQKNAGGQFDPYVVELFLAVYRDKQKKRFSVHQGKKIS
jgi:HD-GYP domain-containing protein (c-di-GMP phosphodiesterase class II)